MKKYKINLACKIPKNYEIEVEAKNPKQAQKLALEAFENDDFESGEMVECEYDRVELDLGKKDKRDGIYIGCYYEELEND